MISSKNIFYHELIGLELKVVDSSNPSLIGLCGTVIDETKNTLMIEVKSLDESGDGLGLPAGGLDEDGLEVSLRGLDEDEFIESSKEDKTKGFSSNQSNHFNLVYKEKLIQKDVSVFQFKVPDGTIVEIDGKILLNRPEDRIKKRYKKI